MSASNNYYTSHYLSQHSSLDVGSAVVSTTTTNLHHINDDTTIGRYDGNRSSNSGRSQNNSSFNHANNNRNQTHKTSQIRRQNIQHLQQFHVLYTNQKTKKRKIWKDGKLTIYGGGMKCRLYEAHPLPGTVSGGVIDELDLRGNSQQLVPVGDCEELESEKYLIRIEGPWNESTERSDGGSSSAASIRSSARPLPSGDTGVASAIQRMMTSSDGVARRNTIQSDGMKKLLSNKYRIPPKMMPLHPEDRNKRANSLIRKVVAPLQPGELERQYYGQGGGKEQDNYFDNVRGAGWRNNDNIYQSNNMTHGHGQSIERGVYKNFDCHGFDERTANYDENNQPAMWKNNSYSNNQSGRKIEKHVRNVNIDNMPSRGHYLTSFNNDDSSVRETNQPNHCNQQPSLQYERQRRDQQQLDGERWQSISNENLPSRLIISSNSQLNTTNQFISDRKRDDPVQESTKLGKNTPEVRNGTQFVSDGYDASELYGEEESDSDEENDDHSNVLLGDNDDQRGGTRDYCSPVKRRDNESSTSSSQTTYSSFNPMYDRHATDELLQLLGAAAPPSSLAPSPADDIRKNVDSDSSKMNVLHTHRLPATTSWSMKNSSYTDDGTNQDGAESIVGAQCMTGFILPPADESSSSSSDDEEFED